MADKEQFYVCSCFYSQNIFIPQYRLHVTYRDDAQFTRDYSRIKTEVERRKGLGVCMKDRKEKTKQEYTPSSTSLPTTGIVFQERIPPSSELLQVCRSNQRRGYQKLKVQSAPEVYSFPIFNERFCQEFTEEIKHFENTDLPKGRPNTMNNYGVLLSELGFDDHFLDPLRTDYLIPICGVLFPDDGGNSLDSQRAFTVQYKTTEDIDLSYHYDNAEVTLNVSLGEKFTGGSLFFGDMRNVPLKDMECTEIEHEPTYGLLHRGQHMHGALPLETGERYNLIIWMRSSSVRNQLCPMCDMEPSLVRCEGYGDGFTTGNTVDVCTTL